MATFLDLFLVKAPNVLLRYAGKLQFRVEGTSHTMWSELQSVRAPGQVNIRPEIILLVEIVESSLQFLQHELSQASAAIRRSQLWIREEQMVPSIIPTLRPGL